jgi:hypothetical protein
MLQDDLAYTRIAHEEISESSGRKLKRLRHKHSHHADGKESSIFWKLLKDYPTGRLPRR